MKPIEPRIRALMKIHGGKSYLARAIVVMMPEHDDFIKAFGGACPELFNKPRRSGLEFYNDNDPLTANVLACVAKRPAELCAAVCRIPYCEEAFSVCKAHIAERAYAFSADAPDVVAAVSTIVVHRFSRGGMGKAFAWSERTRGGQPGDVNAWETYKRDLPAIVARAATFVVVCEDGADLLGRMAENARTHSRRLLAYLDPPYLAETRTRGAELIYRDESIERTTGRGVTATEIKRRNSRDLHTRILDRVIEADAGGAMIMLSGYHSALYEEKLALTRTLTQWRVKEFDMPNNSGQGKTKQRRTECVFYNFELPETE